MTKKEFLSQYISAKRRLHQISDEMVEIRAAATRITPVLDGMPSGSDSVSRIQRVVERLEECAKQLDKEAQTMHAAMREIRQAIATVRDPTLQALLEYRYLNGFTWEQIAVMMHYTYRHVLRLHGEALKRVRINR